MTHYLRLRSLTSDINGYLAVRVVGLVLTITIGVTAQIQNVGLAGASSSPPKVANVTGQLAIGGEITFRVDHLAAWAVSHNSQKLVPFLDGRPLRGLYPEKIDSSKNELQFHLRQTPESKKVWTDLFHEPVFQRPVAVSLGLEEQAPFATVFDGDNPLPFTVIPKGWGIGAIATILGTLMLLVYLARTTNVVRDPGPRPEPGKCRPYNLGRVQMAFWLFIISISYVCLWMITGDVNTIQPSHLALLGISGVTAIGADLAKRKSIEESSSSAAGATSRGFFTDIFSDANGCRFHRFQICAWTFLLGLIFAATVYDDLVMPQFGFSLLALMGMSAGTYLGFTLLERKEKADETAVSLPGEAATTQT